ncbi:hypothetical protein DN752_04405 [Echinicola strongylocentroti]|uniref:Uncharacterized protein n=1 Tax=Echinicola strongylocentroti TaxID=1795355 RepID=A0A2Z4IEZ9_9BACT|nr:hypothetical protein [Echinicola strongylocentroti]AWW29445.1 hypothetical protein DN752_04405 [Echinicola strongylocentroti]
MLFSIDFDHTHFINLCHNFRTFAQREPTHEEMEEIYRIALLLDSYGMLAPTYPLSDFYVVSRALLGTDVEMGFSNRATRATCWIGIYEWEDDLFLVYSIKDGKHPVMEVNHLGSCPLNALLMMCNKSLFGESRVFEGIFNAVYPTKS